jgi:cell wall-associated NlpC family hydrolase
MITEIQPGDVLAVRSKGFAVFMIRFGAALLGKPDLSNHIAVVHHTDSSGVVWCIEGRPGGVGWRDASDYLNSPHTLTNRHQPKTDTQRAVVAKAVEAMLGTPYDWAAIVADGAADLHLDTAWLPVNGVVHGHTVCSALACYAYDKAGLKRPAGSEREDQPADWDAFILDNEYE